MATGLALCPACLIHNFTTPLQGHNCLPLAAVSFTNWLSQQIRSMRTTMAALHPCHTCCILQPEVRSPLPHCCCSIILLWPGLAPLLQVLRQMPQQPALHPEGPWLPLSCRLQHLPDGAARQCWDAAERDNLSQVLGPLTAVLVG